MMRNLVIALIALLALPAFAQMEMMRDTLTIESATGKDHDFKVELALTPRQIQQGLMHRTTLAKDAGMLFYFGGAEEERSFWMKNTLISLDLLFIRADGTIRHIHRKARPHDISGIPSEGPAAAVLEINGGTADRLGIKPGDKVRHSLFEGK